jgi:hypothetical protein
MEPEHQSGEYLFQFPFQNNWVCQMVILEQKKYLIAVYGI